MFYSVLFFLYLINNGLSTDYYKLLGIKKDAENREIRKAFKKLALIHHPDKNKGKEDAHEKFIEITKAYEVLKDEEMRKQYDLFGEKGLQEDFGKSWKGTYHSWNYYYESFGIYDDDDPEIVTLSHGDFERIVLDSSDMWFINFYSPQCAHCHLLAPSWRKLARELQGVIQIGAVNCEEDVMLCRRQNVYSYPSLILYSSSKKTKYGGSRESEDLVEYVLQKLPYNVIQLTSTTYEKEISSRNYPSLPWLIFSCEGSECVSKDDLKKLGIILEHLVYVAEIVGSNNELTCQWLFCESPVTYYGNLTVGFDRRKLQKVIIDDLETSEIVNKVFYLLPELEEISTEQLQDVLKGSMGFTPWLIQFYDEEMPSDKKDFQLKRLKSFLPEINLRVFNCYYKDDACASLWILKFPSFILFRPDGSYEFYYGRISAYDISRFAHAASKSQVHTLNPWTFPNVTQSEEAWFIDFFAPWCPPCLQFLAEYQKVSQAFGHLVKFGTVDCTLHRFLCRSYDVSSYPSAILFKDSVGHNYYGLHSQSELGEFILDVFNPVIVSLSPSTFEEAIGNKNTDDVWVVDFFAPWCGPCQELSPQWRKLAKMMRHLPHVHIGDLDCEAHKPFCGSLGVKNYPTIRLFPRGSISMRKFFSYNGWSRDASSLQAWVHRFLPSNVPVLSDIDFQNVLEDRKPWIIDFFVPWCTHCQTFAPEFEKIAQRIEGKVTAGTVNCDEFPNVCKSASIDSYPTIVFYKGKTSSKSQSPFGEEIHPFSFEDVISFLESRLNLKFKELPLRDEL